MVEPTENPADKLLPTRAADTAPFRIGEWVVDPALNRVSRQDHAETIEPRMMHVLVCLASVPGRVVSRGDLLDVVWGEVVVNEEVLTRAMSRLRIVLGDDRSQPRYFETIRGGGYRLLLEPAPVTPPGPTRSRRRSPWLVPAVTAAAVVVAVLATVLLRRPHPRPPVDVPAAVPVTTLPGNEAYPSLAPDGVTLAFTWTGGEDEDPGLFLTQIASEEVRRLTRPDGMDTRAVFSPDGTTVVFVRNGREVRSVPVLGGATRLLTETAAPIMGLTWSPGGGRLVFATRDGASGQDCLMQLDLATLAVSQLTTVDSTTHIGDSWPAFSPDGTAIAYARCDHAGLRDIWLVPAAGGLGRPLTRGLNDCQGLAWLPDGESLVVSSPVLGKTGLWLVGTFAGSISWVPMIAQGRNTHPTLAPDGEALVFRNLQSDYDLLRLEPSENPAEPRFHDFAPSTRKEYYPAWSPDASQVAFVSDRSGTQALWLARADGRQLRLVASWPEAEVSALQWAPDGRRIAANLLAADRAWFEIIDTETGRTDSPGEAATHERFCGWGPEAGSIRVLRDEGRYWKLYRLREDGSDAVSLGLELAGHPRLHTTDQGYLSVDPRTGGLWLLSGDGLSRRQVLSADAISDWRTFHYGAAGLHVLRVAAEGNIVVEKFDLVGGTPHPVATVPDNAVGLNVAPDGGQILLTIRAEVRSDLMMVPAPVPPIR